jgi:hypothetical protein
MAFPQAKASTTDRGYGSTHAKARKAAALRHQPTDPCTRCGRPLGPMGPWLHYDHTERRDGYLGFAHASCNRKAGARKGQRMSSGGAVLMRRRA